MKIKVGTLKSKIHTDNPALLQALQKLYTFKIPGAEFSTSYKSRFWDGKKYFITKTGGFRSGLLEGILENLKKIECTPEVTFDSPNEKAPKLEKISSFKYYDFQENLVRRALKDKRGVIKAPTGAGKTLIMAGIIKSLYKPGRKMVVLFNAKQLLTQTYEFLTDTCKIPNVGLCFGEGFIQNDIMLCTVQSIEKILDTHLEESEVLLVDEVHEFANGKMTLAAIHSFPKATYRFGFTATPPSDDIPKHNLEGAFGPLFESTSASSLAEEGKLSKPVIQLIHLPEEEADSNLSYADVYENFIIKNEVRNGIIRDTVETIKKNNKKARILILTKNLDHAEILHNLIDGSLRLWGDDDLGTRYKTINAFLASKKATVLIGTKILQTGINIEEITHLINARGLKSEIATLQALGRALRKHSSKETAYIYDFLDKVRYLREHSLARKRHYKKEGHEVIIL